MNRNRGTNGLHLLDLASGPVLYDTNRVTTYRCDALEAELLRAAPSEAGDEPAVGGSWDPEAVREARARLRRLSELSAALADVSGFTAGDSDHPTHLFLHVCHDCNLRCEYCYAGSCEKGRGHLFMTEETARAGVDFLFRDTRRDRRYTCTFAGGEPLLNAQVLEAAASHARRRARELGLDLELRIYTNGTVMSERIFQLVCDHDIFLQITLDGPPESHDRLRPAQGRRRSSDKILDTIDFLKKRKRTRFTVRSNLCPGNSDPANIEDFFHKNGLEDFYLMPVMAEKGSPYRLRGTELRRVTDHYERLADKALDAAPDGSPPVLPQELAPFVEKLELGLKTKRYCGAGREMLVLTPEGHFYPCPAMVGDSRFRVGSLEQDRAENRDKSFDNQSVDEKTVCRDCWARNLCGGGCALQALRMNGDAGRPDPLLCAVIQAKIRGAISLFTKE